MSLTLANQQEKEEVGSLQETVKNLQADLVKVEEDCKKGESAMRGLGWNDRIA